MKEKMMQTERIEKYFSNEMSSAEKAAFELERTSDANFDQQVVEHMLILQHFSEYKANKAFMLDMDAIHQKLIDEKAISNQPLHGMGLVVHIWKKYKRVTAIAASIAGITALVISSLISSISPGSHGKKLELLSRDIETIKKEQKQTKAVVHNLEDNISRSSIDPTISYISGGTGFVIDPQGYLITNYHVVKKARNIAVQNNSGDAFNAVVVYASATSDLAILKIEDAHFKPFTNIPYSIKEKNTDLAESIFTLGFPRDEIVYDQGYLSAKTGYNGDSLSCQLAIAVNPGNSGGPVLNAKGEVIGIINARQSAAQGVVFAIKASHIFGILKEFKEKADTVNIKISAKSALANLERPQQVKKMEDYVFMVKVN